MQTSCMHTRRQPRGRILQLQFWGSRESADGDWGVAHMLSHWRSSGRRNGGASLARMALGVAPSGETLARIVRDGHRRTRVRVCAVLTSQNVVSRVQHLALSQGFPRVQSSQIAIEIA